MDLLPNEALTNFIFPNEATLYWSLMIVIYPYITGLVAGAFVVSSLHHVFKMEAFAPISRFALVVSFCFGLFAGLPLQLHLGHPERAFNIFFTPHFTAAMSIFGYIYSTYMVLLIIEIWLVYREFFVRKANETGGLIWRILTLGVTTCTPESRRVDHKLLTFLAGLGIPIAFGLHGYVGFIFGSMKAIAWWATPLQPIIFLVSAVASGIAALFLMYAFLACRRGDSIDYPLVKKLMTCLWIVFLVDYAIEVLEVGYAYFEHGHHWTVIGPLLNGPLRESYAVWQMGWLSLVPIVLIGLVVLVNLPNWLMMLFSLIGSLGVVTQVLFMRYNVVIGGQLISKSDRGFTEFKWHWGGIEGTGMTLIVMLLPFITYYVLTRLGIPIFGEEAEEETTNTSAPPLQELSGSNPHLINLPPLAP